jgi:hypothetical protein
MSANGHTVHEVRFVDEHVTAVTPEFAWCMTASLWTMQRANGSPFVVV